MSSLVPLLQWEETKPGLAVAADPRAGSWQRSLEMMEPGGGSGRVEAAAQWRQRPSAGIWQLGGLHWWRGVATALS